MGSGGKRVGAGRPVGTKLPKTLAKEVAREFVRQRITQDLDNNWAVVAEAIQTILRRENYEAPYEALKELTRGKSAITQESIREFIDTLKVPSSVKKELKKISPHNYTGIPLASSDLL